MTENSAVKKAIRARMAETGEKYTVARREVVDGPRGGAPHSKRHAEPLQFKPGTLTAVISGGGGTNLGLVMPSLLQMADAGHSVLIAAHEQKPDPWNLASLSTFSRRAEE